MNIKSFRMQLVILGCGSGILMLSFGVRQNYGLYMGPISADMGWGREVFAFAVALQSLIWGLATPISGLIADRYGPAKVTAAGGLLYTAGLYIMSQATSATDATIGVGVLTGFATAMTSFPIVLSAIGRMAPPERRSIYLGIGSAFGSSGQLVLIPLGQWLIIGNGWATAILVLAALTAVMVPLSVPLAGGNKWGEDYGASQSFSEAMREAWGHRGFKLLSVGYFVCGFQTMFIGTHLPAYLTDLDHSVWLGATALALIGGFNIVGCIIWGSLGQRWPKKNLLGILYFSRGVCMAVFMLVPLTPVSVIVFACCMGMLWLGTVPLTTGMVAQIFGTQFMGTLVGITFVSHQIGSFLGIWLGGVIYDAYGTYDPIFWGGVFFGVMAAVIHYPIDERPLARMRAPATQPAQ